MDTTSHENRHSLVRYQRAGGGAAACMEWEGTKVLEQAKELEDDRTRLRRRQSNFSGGHRVGKKRLHDFLSDRLMRHTQRNKVGVHSANDLVRKVFRQYDVDRSGSIALAEFTSMCLDLGIRNVNQVDLNELFDEYSAAEGQSPGNQTEAPTLSYKDFASALVGDDEVQKKESNSITAAFPARQREIQAERTDKERQSSDFKRAVLQAIQSSTYSDHAQAFRAMAGRKGKLRPSALRAGLQTEFGMSVSDVKTFAAFFSSLDKQGAGYLTLDDFVAGMGKHIPAPLTRRKSTFENTAPNIPIKELDELVRDKLEKAIFVRFRFHSNGNPQLIETIFKSYDTDRNGFMELGEFEKMLLDIGIRNIAKPDVLRLFNVYDKGGKGHLDYTEFCKSFISGFDQSKKGILDLPSKVNMHATRYLKNQDLEIALRASFHTNISGRQKTPADVCAAVVNRKTGKIDRKKLFSLLQYRFFVGIGLEGIMEEMFNRIDHNNDGQIYFLDFVNMFMPNVEMLKQVNNPLHKLFAAATSSISTSTSKPPSAQSDRQTHLLLQPTPPPSASKKLAKFELRPSTPSVAPWAQSRPLKLVGSEFRPRTSRKEDQASPPKSLLEKTIYNGLRGPPKGRRVMLKKAFNKRLGFDFPKGICR